MAKDMQAKIKVTADISNAQKGLNTLSTGLGKVKKGIFNLKNLAATALTGFGVAKFSKSIIDAGREVEQLEIKLSRIGDPKNGEKIYRELNKIAIETGTTATKLANAWITMANSGVQLSEQAMRAMADVGNVLGEDVYGVISEQLMLIGQRGEVTIRQLDSFARAGIDARAILEDAFGLPVDKLKENGIQAAQIIDALTKGMGDSFKNAANEVGQSWDGTMALLAAKWEGFKLKINDSGAFDMVKAGLQAINNLADKVFDPEGPSQWGQIITGVAEWGVPVLYDGLIKLSRLVLSLVQGFQSINYVWQSIKTAAWEGVVSQAEARVKQFSRAVDINKKALAELEAKGETTTKKYRELKDELIANEQRLAAAKAQVVQYGKAADESQEKVDKLTQSINALDEGIDNFKAAAAEAGKQLKAEMAYIDGIKNRPQEFITELTRASKDAWQLVSDLMAEIQEATKNGMQASTELVNAHAAAVTKAAAATALLTRAVTEVTNKTQNQQGLGNNSTVTNKLGDLSGAADTAKQLALAEAKAMAEMLKMVSDAEIKALNNLLEDGLISVREYYERRRAELKTQYDADLALLEKQIAATSDAVQKFELQHAKTQLQFSYSQANDDLIREQHKREADLEKEKQALLSEIAWRAMEDTLQNQAAYRLEKLAEQHEAEIQLLREKQATEEEIIQASLNQQLEMEKAKANESRNIFYAQMQSAQTIAGSMADIFQQMYEATGETNKTYLYLAKAAAIAEAIMNTQVAITKALAQGGPIMGPAMAAVAGAMGAAAVATIVAQTFNTGGLVQGNSPHKRADNIPARLTAGEFVHQVDAVNYYGTDIMRALNARAIPKDVLQGLMGNISLPGVLTRGSRLAYGGVAAMDTAAMDNNSGSQSKAQLTLTIVNVSDQEAMQQYLLSTDGGMTIVNTIGANKEAVKQQLELK